MNDDQTVCKQLRKAFTKYQRDDLYGEGLAQYKNLFDYYMREWDIGLKKEIIDGRLDRIGEDIIYRFNYHDVGKNSKSAKTLTQMIKDAIIKEGKVI